MTLEGGELRVLRTLRDLQGDTKEDILADRLAAAAKMFQDDVKDWLETLGGKGYVKRSLGTEGISASITALGKQELRLIEPIPKTHSPKQAPSQRTILLLAANPKGTEPLRLDEEAKKIEQCLERSKLRDQFRLVIKWAVTAKDLRRALLDYEPEIVHFSGHGSGANGLNFEDDQGFVSEIPGETLEELFQLMTPRVKCVVLNACYSEIQANVIARSVDYVVGMKDAILDEASVEFAEGFYDAVAAGRTFDEAFRFGKNAIKLKNIPEDHLLVLKKHAT